MEGMLVHHRVPKHEVTMDGMLVHHRALKHEVTGRITTLHGWDATILDETS